MKKIILISSSLLGLLGLLTAGTPIHDKIDPRILGKSFGGQLDDNVANNDGLGVVTFQYSNGSTKINNELKIQKVIKKIVNNEQDQSKTTNTLLNLRKSIVGTDADRKALTDIGLAMHSDGELCDDGNENTVLDMYKNGICIGSNINFENIFKNGTSYGGGEIDFVNKSVFGYRIVGPTRSKGYLSDNFQHLFNNSTGNFYFEIKPGNSCGYYFIGDSRALNPTEITELDSNYNYILLYYQNDVHENGITIDLKTKQLTLNTGSGGPHQTQYIDMNTKTHDFSNVPNKYMTIGVVSIQAQQCWNKFLFEPNEWILK